MGWQQIRTVPATPVEAALAEVVAAIAADALAKRDTVLPDSKRPTYARVAAARAQLRAAMLEQANG